RRRSVTRSARSGSPGHEDGPEDARERAMKTEELISGLRRDVEAGASPAVLVARIDALAEAHGAHRRIEERLRRNHATMMRLARSPSLGTGELDASLREITECASEVLGV